MTGGARQNDLVDDLRVVVGGHHVDREVRANLADVVDNPDTVLAPQLRKVEIAKHDVDRKVPAERHGRGGFLRFQDLRERKAGLRQHHLQQAAEKRVVVDDQDVLAVLVRDRPDHRRLLWRQTRQATGITEQGGRWKLHDHLSAIEGRNFTPLPLLIRPISQNGCLAFLSRFVKWFWRFSALLGILLILVTATPVVRYGVSALSTQWGTDRGNTLIVLGQDVTAPDMLGIGSYWRSFYAVLLWRENHYRRIVVTGKDAAPLMRDLMVNQGVPREIITVENAATSTRENALFVARILAGGDLPYVLLTSDYHMGRALRTFRKAGVTASPLPYPDAGKRLNDITERWGILLELIAETSKTAYYRIRGWI